MPTQKVPDRTIAQKVNQALISHGFRPPCHINVTVRNADVTLTGTIQYENQRRNAMRTAQGVAGVRRVLDQLHVQEHPIWADRIKTTVWRLPPEEKAASEETQETPAEAEKKPL